MKRLALGLLGLVMLVAALAPAPAAAIRFEPYCPAPGICKPIPQPPVPPPTPRPSDPGGPICSAPGACKLAPGT